MEFIIGFLLIALAVWLYFLPSIVAFKKKHENATSILVVNALFGLTLLGWVFALVWAIKNPAKVVVSADAMPASLEGGTDYAICPYCSEIVKKAAIKCKHCGSDLNR